MQWKPLSHKILEQHAVEGKPEEGEIILAKVDKILLNDVTAPLAFKTLDEAGAEPRHPDIEIHLDHYSPPPTIETANIHAELRRRAKKHGIKLHEVGEGIMHQVAVEESIKPGQLVIGADSHTPTCGALAAMGVGVGSSEAAYAMATGTLWFKVPKPVPISLEGRPGQAVTGKDIALHILAELGARKLQYTAPELHGPALKHLTISDRLTIANMLVEGGVKTTLFPIDEKLAQQLNTTPQHTPTPRPEYTIDTTSIEPMIAPPPNPLNAKPVTELEGVEVDQVFIGSCTNGRLEDIAAAARILKGRKTKTRLIITPASRRTLQEALKRGYIQALVQAGAIITPPGCGLCFGAHMGLLADNEVMVSTANRNFPGRNGARTAKTYLTNPLTAAATAATGRITDPRRLKK